MTISVDRLYVNWRFMRGIQTQFSQLQKGFQELISQHLLRPFDERELEVRIVITIVDRYSLDVVSISSISVLGFQISLTLSSDYFINTTSLASSGFTAAHMTETWM